MASAKKQPLLIGWREWVELPDLTAIPIKAKIDTGARTSAIHAWKIQRFSDAGMPWVRFELHPVQKDNRTRIACTMPVHDEREIRSSNGEVTVRLVVKTRLRMDGRIWPIELTLARRDQMGFRMLIGRTALKRRVLIDPSDSYLTGREPGPV
ncbi:ATP-dependent zinc protease family protein [Hyphobacterium vulgare]|uniref:ATP-dependent zinc protease family protein n=1 Tax=Hyphobacterium vulgare TaxID=1736751 RepID=UPI0031B7B0EA